MADEHDPYDDIRRYQNNAYSKYKKYGVTQAMYADMLREQGGVCAVCGNPETGTIYGKVRELAIDHDHDTGKVRGLLCANCNSALGMLRDDIRYASAALRYLKKHCFGGR